MTDLLLRLFAGDCADSSDTAYRMKVGRLSGFVGILSNAVLCVLKLIVGSISGSVSITADAMNNLSDAASSVVTLIGFRLSEMPEDSKHPYGHARFEYLSGLTVAVMILLIGAELFQTSVKKIITPTEVSFTLPVAVVLTGSILVKLWLGAFNSNLGKRIDSAALRATAADSINDTYSTGAVLVAAVVAHYTGWQIDGYIGLLVALFILYSGVTAGMETISPLLGEASNPELCRAIATHLRECPEVLGLHDLLVHDYGPGKRFASIHVEMDSKRDPMETHELIDDLEKTCFEKLKVALVIHYDPIIVGDPETDKIKHEVIELLKAKDSRLSIHDFRMVPGEGHTNIIFDVVLPYDLDGQELEIKRYIEKEMSAKGKGNFYAVIAFDSESFNNSSLNL